MTPTAAVADVCEVNPTLRAKLAADDLVGFVGMADLDAEAATATDTEVRVFSDLKGYTPFERGDILVAKITPCFENRKTGQATTSTPVAFGSTEFHVLRPHNDAIDARYLLHFLRRDAFLKLGEMRMTGAGGQRRVPTRIFAELVIPLPPLGEQQRIAGVLDAADGLRTKRRQALAKLDTLTQAIFIDMFGDPVSNPRGWPVDALTKLGDLDRGVSKHRPRNDPVLLGGDWPLIQTGDVAASGGYITEFTATYSDVGLAQSKIWPVGTLCITIAANIAKTGILSFEACFPDSVVGFTAGLEGASEYVRCILSSLQPVLEKQAPESAQKNINLKILRGLQVPIPPEELVVRFAQRACEVNALSVPGLRQQLGLDALFSSLQQRAFRGEL